MSGDREDENKGADSESYTCAVVEIFGSVVYFSKTNKNFELFLMLVTIYPSKSKHLLCVPCKPMPNRVKFLKNPRKRDKTHQTLSKTVLKSITQTTIKKQHSLDGMQHRSDRFWWVFKSMSGQMSGHLEMSGHPHISNYWSSTSYNSAVDDQERF